MEEKTYLITHENGTRRKITVPADWKVTFGPAAKGLKHDGTRGLKIPLALRFYESDTKQRAIFTDVVSFRDTSIKIEEEKVRIQEKDGYTECEGVRQRTTFQAKVREWINPDAIAETPALPSDTKMFDMDEE